MFNDIRSRLIISYIIVIFVALAISFGSLIAIRQPMQDQFTYRQLTDQMTQLVKEIQETKGNHRGHHYGYNARQLPATIVDFPQNNISRLLVIADESIIVFDSHDRWQGRTIDLPEGAFHMGMMPKRMIDPDKHHVMYVNATISMNNSTDLHLLLTTNPPMDQSGFIDYLINGFIVAGLIAFFISVLLGLLITRSIANPLQGISVGAKSVAMGNYQHQVPEVGPDEVKALAQSFNAMTKQVRASQIAMRDFVSNVSHDLKTPLTSIQGFSQAMLDGAVHDEAMQKKATSIIHEEANRMRRLVDNLLDLANLDAGQIAIEQHAVNLTQLLTITIDSLALQAQDKRINIIQEISALTTITGDGDRLSQVFTNLVDNAIKYTSHDGTIKIHGEITVRQNMNGHHSNRFAKITINDTGIGIPSDELPRIFERFYQVDKSRQGKNGTGLGLAIAQNIITSHDGYLEVKSELGIGSHFTVWLPVVS
ncbi:MAG: hypothetical protein B6242_08880 [Anaerolineaceae bacterium 4572_78]|nr:MAG: hypothetical protein B6242_08880 [Anaerolineaceae bacterium 4572_78]